MQANVLAQVFPERTAHLERLLSVPQDTHLGLH